jgi:uncharacterized peroxidase-related enzyme
MPNLASRSTETATGKAASLFGAITKAIGAVPNAYADIGSNSPLALEAILALDAAVGRSSLSATEIEAIKLAVSNASGCTYCLAAHGQLAEKRGLSRTEVRSVATGTPSGEARLDALAAFARTLVTTRGDVPIETLNAVRKAGFTDAQIVDGLLAITSITFTNLFNRVNDTILDFPEFP